MHDKPPRAASHSLTNQQTFLTLVCSIILSSPNFRIHTCSASESLPSRPELPESFCATDHTASSVMLTGMKIWSPRTFLTYDRRVFFARMFSLQNRCDGLVDHTLYNLQPICKVVKLPPFLFHRQIIRLCTIFPSGQV